MSLAESKITSQGQISIPAIVRQKLGLTPGSVIEWYEENGNIVVKRSTKFSSKHIHDVLFKQPVKPKDLDSFDEGISKHMRKKYARD